MYIIALEKDHQYNKAPGSNRQTLFKHSYLKTLYNAPLSALSTGDSFSQTVQIGDLATTKSGRPITLSKVGVAVIIYDLTTKERITGGILLP